MGSVTSQKNPETANLAQSLKQQPGSLYGTYLGLLSICDSYVVWFIVNLMAIGVGAAPGALAVFGNLFLILECLVHPEHRGKCMVLLQLEVACFANTHGRPAPF